MRIHQRSGVFDGQDMRKGDHMGAKRGSGTRAMAGSGLHVCPHCGSKLVQPTCWEQTRRRGCWRVWRRCPECDWQCSSIHGEREIDAYDEELDNGTAALACELEEMQRESMEELIGAFSAALESDLIGADDFR